MLVVAAPLHAGETGSISGVTRSSLGDVLPGASVRVSGEYLPAGREVTTTGTGDFLLQRLAPGSYRVVASLRGHGAAAREVRVHVDVDTQIELVLARTPGDQGPVVVETPVVDMKTAELNFNYTSETIERLPLERSYAGLFQLVPGVADNDSFAPNAGASRQDNMFLVDGVNITNPGYGYLSTEINELDIAELNVKRGAISAAFGRAAGVVTNVVTRSGSNDFHGSARFEAVPEGLIGDPSSEAEESGRTSEEKRGRLTPAISLSGPLMRDTAWWYTSGRLHRSSLSGRRNDLGPVPDESTKTEEYFVKLTARPGERHSLSASYRHRPSEVEFHGIGANDLPELATNDEGTNKILAGTWSFFPMDRTLVDLQYTHLEEQNETVAVTDLGSRGSFDVGNPGAMGEFFDSDLGTTVGGASLKLDRQSYKRDQLRMSFTQLLDVGRTKHEIEAGFGYETTEEDLTRISNAWGSVSLVQNDTQLRASYYPDQPPQLGRSRTLSIFVQDAVTVSRRLTLNAGLLANRDEFSQETDQSWTFLIFGYREQLQPRIGFNFNPREGMGDKLYGHYGRYYSLEQKSTSRSLAPYRLFTQDTVFDAVTGAVVSDAVRGAATGKLLDPELKPTYQDEFLGGYATPLTDDWSLDVFFMFRDLSDVIEDLPQALPASNRWYSNVPEAERRYRALVLELGKRFSNRWSFRLSYSWSQLHGNFDLDYATAGLGDRSGDEPIDNTSSDLQDGPGLFVFDSPEWCQPACLDRFGPLTQDRTHVLKAFATLVPLDGLTLGGYLRVQSGTPYEGRGRDWYGEYRRYLEPPGTYRNDTWTNLDLLVTYRFALAEQVDLSLEARALNLLDAQTALTRDNRLYLDARSRNWSAAPYLIQGMTQPNPRFGQGTRFAQPRHLELTLRLDF
jgi:hypothetical protein